MRIVKERRETQGHLDTSYLKLLELTPHTLR